VSGEDPWKSYRVKGWAFAIIALTLLPAILLLGGWVDRAWKLEGGGFLAVGALWASLLLIPGFLVRGFLCPRCNEPFFDKGLVYFFWARRCVHCGLPKWAPHDPDPKV